MYRIAHPNRAARIVLAEDDASTRWLHASALDHDGHDVFQAGSGTELVSQIRRLLALGEEIDLIVSDLRTPRMSGLAVLRLLRDAEFTTPFILMTAFSDVTTRTVAREYGATVLDKPLRLSTLRLAVELSLPRFGIEAHRLSAGR